MPRRHGYDESPYLTIGQAALMIGVSVPTLRRWEKAGRITPARTDGGHRRYRRTDVEALLTTGSAA